MYQNNSQSQFINCLNFSLTMSIHDKLHILKNKGSAYERFNKISMKTQEEYC